MSQYDDIVELRKRVDTLERQHRIDMIKFADAGKFVAAAIACGFSNVNQKDALCYALGRLSGEDEPIVLQLLVSIMTPDGTIGTPRPPEPPPEEPDEYYC